MQIILASSSPRRKQILESVGLKVKVVMPGILEEIRANENFVSYARRIAQEKGNSVLLQLQSDFQQENLIISGDTDVVLAKKVLGKPKNREEAKNMLMSLSNRKHYVISALSIIHNNLKIKRNGIAHTVSIVSFGELSDKLISAYLDSMEWQGKAGGYAIQGEGSYFLNYFQGSVTSIIGFPLRLFYRILMGMEIDIVSLWNK